MTKDEFKEIREAWTELKAIFDEIDALNNPAGIKVVSDTVQKASAH
jgi:NADP-dependent 3-hydroxy acid dehydrogenase YdfG